MSTEHDKDKEIPVEIQASQLSKHALNGVIESFILREGTDYGIVEVDYQKKIEQIQRQISRGEVKIVFDQITETVSLMTTLDFVKLQKKTGP
jgi:uncharacterized protein YheU (UPF0270 family)